MSDLPNTDDGAVIPGVVRHLSASSIGMYLRCPRQYWYRYIIGKRIPPGGALVQGLSVHKAAERGMLEKIADGRNPSPSACMEWAASEANRILTEEEHIVAKAERGGIVDFSVRIANCWATTLAPIVEPKVVEQDFDVRIADTKVIGRIDVVDTSGRVIDWKTASRAPSKSDQDLTPQTMIYAHVTDAPVSYRYMVGLKTQIKTVDLDIEGTELERAKALTEELVSDVADAIGLGVFPRNTQGWHCSPKMCGYYARCMSGKERP